MKEDIFRFNIINAQKMEIYNG